MKFSDGHPLTRQPKRLMEDSDYQQVIYNSNKRIDELKEEVKAMHVLHVENSAALTTMSRWLDNSKAELAETSAKAHRLALELECLLLDTKDIAIKSKWWDGAMVALTEWQEFTGNEQPHVSAFGKD